MICRTSEHYVLYYYVKPYTRYGPFLIGILTGIYLTTKKDQLLKQKVRTFDYLPQSLHTAKSSSRNTKHIMFFSCCCSSGRQHLVGSAVYLPWLCWLDWPTSSGRPRPIHLCHMPYTRVCTDHSGPWL